MRRRGARGFLLAASVAVLGVVLVLVLREPPAIANPPAVPPRPV